MSVDIKPPDRQPDKPVERDSSGRFVKGNTAAKEYYASADDKEKTEIAKRNQRRKLGRPKGVKTQVKDALKLAEASMPSIIANLVDIASGKSPNATPSLRVQAATYLVDRIYGKANQPFSGNMRQQIVREIINLPAGWPKSVEASPGVIADCKKPEVEAEMAVR